MRSDTGFEERPWRPNAMWLAIAAYFLFVSFGSNLLELRYSYLDRGLAGDWGMTFTPPDPDVVVQSVEPGSAAAALGIRPGDKLHSDQFFTFRRIPLVGETLRFSRVAPGAAMPMQIVAARAETAPMAVPNLLDRIFDDGVRCLLAVGGLWILWRGGGRRSGFILGIALLSMAPFPPVWLPLGRYASYGWGVGVLSLFYAEYALLLPLFSMAFLGEAGVRVPRWARLAFLGGVTATMAIYVIVAAPPGVFPSSTGAAAEFIRSPLAIACFALTIALLGTGWRRGLAESRHRFALLLLAIGLIFLSNMFFVLFDTFTKSNPRVLTNSSTLLRIFGSLLLMYAVLRHKVIDVGFTLNRTLVYGGVSAILLIAFGLAEWGLHELLALEGWEGSALLSAGLAVVIVLAFHPVRRFVEHSVSTIFFRPWRNKEQALRKFVHEAAFFSDPARLAAGFAGALEQFSGATCRVYRLGDDESFACSTGDAATAHADDPTPVALRAHAAVCEIDGSSSVEGVLAFPMIHCHDLEGFAVLGRKPDGDHYRPDEIELVEWATRQVGQDLYGLTVDQLREEREEREREIAILTGRNADLQLALSNRAAPRRLGRVPAKAAPAL